MLRKREYSFSSLKALSDEILKLLISYVHVNQDIILYMVKFNLLGAGISFSCNKRKDRITLREREREKV